MNLGKGEDVISVVRRGNAAVFTLAVPELVVITDLRMTRKSYNSITVSLHYCQIDNIYSYEHSFISTGSTFLALSK